MRILFINPPSNTHYRVPPLGLGYCSSAVAGHGHVGHLLDFQRERTTFVDLARVMTRFRPHVIGVQSFSCDIAAAVRVMTFCRYLNPDVTIILGGAHASGLGEQVLTEVPDCDFAYRGEAEEGLPRLLDLFDAQNITAETLANVPGLLWRDVAHGGRPMSNGQSFPSPLDELAIPDWKLMDPRLYPLVPQGVFYRQAPIAPILTSRGCPYRCTFCAGPIMTGHKLRLRSVEGIMEEVSLLVRNYGVRELHIVDDTFTSSKQRVMAFCEALRRSFPTMSFTMPNGVRLDTLDREMLQAMKVAGCHSLIVGIESGSQRILDDMHKGTTCEEIREKITLIHEIGLSVRGFFIIGYPTETKEDIEKTIAFATALPLEGAHFSSFLPLPGTEITRQLLHDGELSAITYSRLFYSKIPYHPPAVSHADIGKLIRRAYLAFYLRPAIMVKLIGQIRSPRHLLEIVRRFFDYALGH